MLFMWWFKYTSDCEETLTKNDHHKHHSAVNSTGEAEKDSTEEQMGVGDGVPFSHQHMITIMLHRLRVVPDCQTTGSCLCCGRTHGLHLRRALPLKYCPRQVLSPPFPTSGELPRRTTSCTRSRRLCSPLHTSAPATCPSGELPR
jgi:hypothetical protein